MNLELEIPERVWEGNEFVGDGFHALRTTVTINGVPMHLEAWEVTEDEAGIQSAVAEEYMASYDSLFEAVSADKRFMTTQIRGREYVIVASPYCD